MTDKHILRKKKFDENDILIHRTNPESGEEEWSRVTTGLGEKIQDVDVMDVQDRSITFNKNEATEKKIEEPEPKKTNLDFKDHVDNTAQYLKFVNAHLAAKKSKLLELKRQSEDFDREVAKLKPQDQRTKSDLDLINYKEIKPEDVRKVLASLEKERDEALSKVEHFSMKLSKANEELEKKNSEMEVAKSELESIKDNELSQNNETIKEENAMEVIQNQLTSLDSKAETGKIFGAINALVILLNSKNQETLNELNSIKSEFNSMKNEYDKAIQKLNKKK